MQELRPFKMHHKTNTQDEIEQKATQSTGKKDHKGANRRHAKIREELLQRWESK